MYTIFSHVKANFWATNSSWRQTFW